MNKLLKQLLTIIFLLNLGFAFGQDFLYPSVEKQGINISSFIPNGWSLLDSTQGDLNNDDQKDLALIVQHKDFVKTINIEQDTVLTQPRILIILFYNQATNQYQLVEQNNSFILNYEHPNMEDPYQDISIHNGVLQIDFHFFMNTGGWGMSNNSYLFRFQDNDFVLIGAVCNYVNRLSGETENRAYNFLTKKVKVAVGNIENDHQEINWGTIHLQEFKTFKTFKQPFTWEIETNIYL